MHLRKKISMVQSDKIRSTCCLPLLQACLQLVNLLLVQGSRSENRRQNPGNACIVEVLQGIFL